MRLQGAIFDMDGTLLDSMYVWDSFASRMLRELGREPEPGLEDLIKTMSLAQSVAYVREHYHLPQSEQALIDLVNSRVHRLYAEEVQPKPDVEKFLSLLKMEGVWMYVATATDRVQAEAALNRTGLMRYFRGILTCAEAGAGKDSPVIFEKCLTRLRCRKADCVVFEDALHAIKTAKAAGFRVAAVYDASAEQDQPEIRRLADYYLPSYGAWLERGQ
jgi:HAD superfamily hydrolase (TIGR01509 family)